MAHRVTPPGSIFGDVQMLAWSKTVWFWRCYNCGMASHGDYNSKANAEDGLYRHGLWMCKP